MDRSRPVKRSMLVRSLGVLLCTILLLAAAPGRLARSGQPPPPEPRITHRAFDPADLQEGYPLPGADYPWRSVTGPAPAGWAPVAPPPGIDLDVTYIKRAPMYLAYCVQYPGGVPTLCPGTESEQRWPAPGEVVTFTAHVVNKGTVASPSFGYAWSIDGAGVLSDTYPALAPGAEATLTYAWPWGHTLDGEQVVDDHTVGFEVDPDDLVAESYEANNRLVDRTNALGFRLAITPEMYQAYNIPWNAAFSYSAEDWLQRQIAAMNGLLANSIYSTTPGGATERVRINEIVITSTPPMYDRLSDGGWFVDADYRLVSGGYDPVADVDWNLVHELSHQVGLIDLYMLGISTNIVQVADREGGSTNFSFAWPRPGLMGGGDIAPHTDAHLYSSHSAAGLSSTKGYRRGYYGEYQFDIPEQNYLQILDNQGNPDEGVQVALYQRTGPAVWPGEPTIDDVPEVSGLTGPDGRLLLANRPVGGGVTTRTGHTLHDNPFGVVDVVGGRNIFLLKLSRGSHEEFSWLDITDFNLAYWQGDTLSHTFTLATHLPPPGAPDEPQDAQARVEGSSATICWQASSSPGVVGYRVYRAAPPAFTYQQAAGLVSGPCYTEIYAATRIYAATAVDGSGLESGFSNFAWAPRLINPYAVGVTSDGQRTVLDPQNGYALLRQRPDGRYVQNVGSPHYHLERSLFLAVDQDDRLVISHPGDWYVDRHSVRVADRDASPLLEFGQRGSGPGEFETPAGVAAVGRPSSVEGPYPDDAHTLLLLHFDGSYTGTQGESGTPIGTEFQAGKYAQGVVVDASDTLTYPTAGNLQRTQGAVEFWLRPDWDGADGASHTFFEIGDTWFNRLRIMKDGANNLRFMVWDGGQEYGVAYPVGHWQAGEWHHVAVTWQDTSIALYVDGQQRSGRDDAHPPDVLGATIYVGSASWQGQQADAVLDELRISDLPRIGQSSSVPYRILVADRYNHRLQAFDELGRFVTAFGEHGAGLGQFDGPRGLVATDQGLVVVADSDNDRLQILAFDGFEFTPVREVQAGLSSPTGVALYGQDRIVVADTGNDRIVVLDMDGNLLAGHTGPNDGYTGPFSLPQGVLAECATGDIVVADQGNQRVVRILDALPILANFAATPISGRVPLTVTFTNASCGNYTSSLWDLGDGLTSTMTHAVHTYTQPGVYTVTLTASGPTGSTVETRPAYIRVWAEQGICLPLVLKGEEPPPPTPTPEPGDCYPQQVAAPSVGRTPHGLAVDGAGGRLLVGNHEDDTLSVIDITIYDLLETVSAGDGPNGVAHDPGSDRIYVANRNANTVTVLRGSDYGLVAAVAVGSLPNGVAVDPGGRRVYVANFGSGTLSVIDGDSLDVIDTIPVGAEPSMVTVNQVTGKVYVTLHGEGRVAAIDGAGSVTSVDLQSAGPYGVTVDQVNNHVYVATIDSARIVVVDGSTDTLLGWAEIRRSGGGEPVPLRLVAVDPLLGASGHLFVTTTGEDGGWDRVLMLPKGWNEGFAQPIALELDEPREGIALEAASHRVFVSSRAGDLVAVYLDGEPPCPGNFALAGEYQVSVVPRAGW